MKIINTKKIAFSSSLKGIHGELSTNFGHTPAFTIINYEEETFRVLSVEILQNAPHQQGKCRQPVMLLKNAGVHAIVVGNISRRPLMEFRQVGIVPYQGLFSTVKENFLVFKHNSLEILTSAHKYQGGNF